MRRKSVIWDALIVGCLLARIDAVWAQQPANAAVDTIFSDLSKPGSPGCALGVYRDGKIIYAKGYGLANIEESVPITPETVFDVGSVSKQFTAASILLLERQGKLRLDDEVRKYIPELPDYSAQSGHKITILELLNHTSGIRDYTKLFSLAGVDDDDVTTDDDALGIIVRQKAPSFLPGSEYLYTGSGYFLMSLIVKRVSGKNLKDFAAANIFQPLGMQHSQYRNDHTSLIPHRALAYDPGGNGGYKLSVSYGEETGDGMVNTTVGDLQKWDENFYSGQIGGKDFATEMEEPGRLGDGRPLEYAKGLRVWNYRGLNVVSHSGGSGGYHSYFLRFPGQHFAVATLCNAGSLNHRKRARAVVETYLSSMMILQERAAPSVPDELHALTGTYRDPKTAEIWRVAADGTELQVDFEGQPVQLRPLSSTEFEPVDYPFEVRLKFEPRAQNGSPRKLTVEREMELPATFEAVEVTRPTVADLNACTGDYWSDELRATYRLAIKNEKLSMTDLIGADGVSHTGTVPFNALEPVRADEYTLSGAPITFHFVHNTSGEVTGFTLDAFRERGMVFTRLSYAK